MPKTCRVRRCTRPVSVRVHQLCVAHYKRYQREVNGGASPPGPDWLKKQAPLRRRGRPLPVLKRA